MYLRLVRGQRQGRAEIDAEATASNTDDGDLSFAAVAAVEPEPSAITSGWKTTDLARGRDS